MGPTAQWPRALGARGGRTGVEEDDGAQAAELRLVHLHVPHLGHELRQHPAEEAGHHRRPVRLRPPSPRRKDPEDRLPTARGQALRPTGKLFSPGRGLPSPYLAVEWGDVSLFVARHSWPKQAMAPCQRAGL